MCKIRSLNLWVFVWPILSRSIFLVCVHVLFIIIILFCKDLIFKNKNKDFLLLYPIIMILKYDIFLLTQARYSIGEITIANAHVKLFQNNQADYDFSSGRNKPSMFIQLKIIFIEYGKRCISYRLVLF